MAIQKDRRRLATATEQFTLRLKICIHKCQYRLHVMAEPAKVPRLTNF